MAANSSRIWSRNLRLKSLVCCAILAVLLLLLVLFALLRPQSATAATQHNGAAICDSVQGIPISECQALAAFYVSTNGDNWITHTNWLQTNTPCLDWYGIGQCYNGQVIDISLPSNNISGTLPAEIEGLQGLRILSLHYNHLAGTLPVQLGGLAALQVIDLSGNQLTGDLNAIPWENLQQLQELRLDANAFSGNIPPELGDLENLERLWLHANNLSGPIPSAFGATCINGSGGMCQLRELFLQRQVSRLSGSLPASLGMLTNLQQLSLGGNDFSGEIPSALMNLANLDLLTMDDNRLQGELPDFTNLVNLTDLRLDTNALTGTIPSNLGTLTKLEWLWLHNNQLRGPVPAAVACLPGLIPDPLKSELKLTLAGNLLYIDDEVTSQCLNGPIGLGEQTVPPAEIRIGTVTDTSVELLWSPIYRSCCSPGYYQIAVTRSWDETPVFDRRTADKTTARYIIRNLVRGTDYYVHMRTYTPATGDQRNVLTSTTSWPLLKVRTTGESPTFSFSKTVTPTQVMVGELITYTLTFSRTGGLSIIDIVDPVDPGVTFQEITQGAATFQNSSVVLSGTIEANKTITVEYRALVNAQVKPGSILYSEARAVRGDGDVYLASAAVAVQAEEQIETLVLIYASGDNNLSVEMQGLFQKAEAAAKPDGMVVLLLFDDSAPDDAYYYRLQTDSNIDENCPNSLNRTCGRYQEGVDMWPWSDALATKASLSEFVARAMQAYPAETVILSLVGHGSGWSPTVLLPQPSTHDEKPDDNSYGGILWDKNPSSALSTARLGSALKNVVDTTGKTIDLLYLDACLMGMSEVAYELSGTVDYLLASESISWASFPYDLHLSWPSAPTDPIAIGRAWTDNETARLSGESGVAYPYTYSLLDLTNDNASELLRLENQLALSMIAALSSREVNEPINTRQRIVSAAKSTDCFDSNQDHTIDENDYYCDLYSFARELETVFTDTPQSANTHSSADDGATVRRAAIVKASIDLQAILNPNAHHLTQYERHNGVRHPLYPNKPPWIWNDLGGVSIYLPIQVDDWKRRYYTAAYLRSAADGYWDEFLDAYFSFSPAPRDVATCKGVACIPLGPESVKFYMYLPVIVAK